MFFQTLFADKSDDDDSVVFSRVRREIEGFSARLSLGNVKSHEPNETGLVSLSEIKLLGGLEVVHQPGNAVLSLFGTKIDNH